MPLPYQHHNYAYFFYKEGLLSRGRNEVWFLVVILNLDRFMIQLEVFLSFSPQELLSSFPSSPPFRIRLQPSFNRLPKGNILPGALLQLKASGANVLWYHFTSFDD